MTSKIIFVTVDVREYLLNTNPELRQGAKRSSTKNDPYSHCSQDLPWLACGGGFVEAPPRHLLAALKRRTHALHWRRGCTLIVILYGGVGCGA